MSSNHMGENKSIKMWENCMKLEENMAITVSYLHQKHIGLYFILSRSHKGNRKYKYIICGSVCLPV